MYSLICLLQRFPSILIPVVKVICGHIETASENWRSFADKNDKMLKPWLNCSSKMDLALILLFVKSIFCKFSQINSIPVVADCCFNSRCGNKRNHTRTRVSKLFKTHFSTPQTINAHAYTQILYFSVYELCKKGLGNHISWYTIQRRSWKRRVPFEIQLKRQCFAWILTCCFFRLNFKRNS